VALSSHSGAPARAGAAGRAGRLGGRGGLALGLALLALNLVLANLLAARHPLRADWTRARVFSLSPRTVAVLEGLRRPVDVTVFMVPPERYQDSLYHEARELLRRFTVASPQVRVEQVDVDADRSRAELLAQQHTITAADLKDGVIVVASGGRSKYVTSGELAEYSITPEGRKLTAFRGEEALLRALLAVTAGEPPTVCFVQGHGEAAIDSYADPGFGRIADEVKRDGYRVRAAGTAELEAGLQGCAVTVLGGPTRGFSPVEVDALDRALRRRGRLLVLLGPVLDRRVTRHARVGLEEWLAGWGARPMENLVLDPLAVPGEQPLLTWASREAAAGHPIGRALAGRITVWPLTREVRPQPRAREGLQVTALISSSAAGWGEVDLGSLRGERQLRLDPQVDTPGPVPVAVAVAWRESRLVVLGSERGVLNQRLAGPQRDHDRELFLAALGWLAPLAAAAPAAVGPKTPEHIRLLLDERQLSRVYLLTVVALPLLSLAAGLLVWWRRRR